MLHEVELNLDWIKEYWMACEEYLKLMIDYGMPIVELDP